MPAQTDTWEVAFQQATNSYHHGDFVAAKNRCDSLFRLLDTLQHPVLASHLYTLRGNIALQSQQTEAAMALHRRALAFRQKWLGKEDLLVSNSFINLGHCFLQKKQPAQSLQQFHLAQTIKFQHFSALDTNLIELYNGKVLAYLELNQVDSAWQSAQKLNTIFTQTASTIVIQKQLATYSTLAAVYLRAFPINTATLKIEELIATLPPNLSAQTIPFAQFYVTLAAIFFDYRQPNKAFVYLEKSLDLYEQRERSYSLVWGECLLDVGVLLLNQGKAYQCLRFFTTALIHFRAVKDIEGEILTHYQLSVAKQLLGLPEEALTHLDSGMTHLIDKDGVLKARESTPLLLQQMGDCYTTLQDWGQALINLNKAVHFLEQSENRKKEQLVNGYQKIAYVYLQKGDFQRTERYLNQALKLRNTKADYTTFLYFGHLYVEKEDFQTALFYYQKAANIVGVLEESSPITFVNEAIQIRLAMAKLHQRKAVRTKSETDWQAVLTICQAGINLLNQRTNQILDVKAESQLRHLFSELYSYGITANLALQDTLGAFQYSESYKGNILFQKFSSVAALPNPIADSLRQKLTEIDQKIAQLEKREGQNNWKRATNLHKDSSPTDAPLIRLESQKIVLEKAINQATTSIAKKYKTPNSIDLAKIQSSLSKNETILQYHWSEEKIHLFAITADSFRYFPITLDPEQLINKIRTYYQLVVQKGDLGTQQDSIYTRFVELSHELYQYLLSPAKLLLKKTLIIIPDSYLGYLPFEALIEKINMPKAHYYLFNDHHYLLKKYTIRYANSIDLMNGYPNTKPVVYKKSILAIAPDFSQDDRGFKDISNTLKETKDLHRKYGGTLWQGQAATGVKFLNESAQYPLVHVATHGTLDNLHPENAFLVFASTKQDPAGLLFASEIYPTLLPIEHLVLMVCQTAGGQIRKGEGLFSLVQTFLYAGVQSIVGNLWDVMDEEAPSLVKYYYEHLLDQQTTKAQALRQAKLDYLAQENDKFAHPYYWAGFVIIGKDAPMLLPTINALFWQLFVSALCLLLISCVIRWRTILSPRKKNQN
ncbi:MAG: CHAT domain-containing tetratricopeptide repeat protein [Bacteroidota bacterium]